MNITQVIVSANISPAALRPVANQLPELSDRKREPMNPSYKHPGACCFECVDAKRWSGRRIHNDGQHSIRTHRTGDCGKQFRRASRQPHVIGVTSDNLN